MRQLHSSVQPNTETNSQITKQMASGAKALVGIKKNAPKMQLIVTDPETGAKSVQTYSGTTQLGSPISVS